MLTDTDMTSITIIVTNGQRILTKGHIAWKYLIWEISCDDCVDEQ